MHTVLTYPGRLLLSLAALLLIAASWAEVAVFSAPDEGSDLAPVAGADRVVEILQGNQAVLWSSLTGPISMVEVEGWPMSIDDNDLGGAVVIENLDGATAGAVDFGEKPRTLTFNR